MNRLPLPYLAGLVVIVGLALFLALAAFGVIPIEQLFLFFVSNVLMFVLLLVFAALGGAFVGMIIAQRIFSSREFTPLERSLVDALASLKDVRESQTEVLRRLEAIEKRER